MYAVILLPNFRLQAALRFREELAARPAAIVGESDPKAGLLEINDVAQAAGVVAGQTSSQALARCGALAIFPRSPAQEDAVQAALLEIAGTLSPEIEATAGGICTVNLRASRERDWTARGTRLLAALAALGLRGQIGVAANPDLAFIAARHARPVLVVQTPQIFLASLALHELAPAPELLAVLRDWGIHNLAQLTSLPRGELLDRLGPEAARLWERASGKTERPLRLVRPSEEFAEAFDFEREVETSEPLLFILRRLLGALATRLGGVHRVAGRMALTLTLAGGGTHARTFTVPSPTADAEVLFRILHTHLEALRLAQPATGVRLHLAPALAERQQFQLFESPLRDPNRFGETLGRLAALVGAENVGAAEVLDTHRPDSFRLNAPHFHELPAEPAPPGAGEKTPLGAEENSPVGLPLRRWRPPAAAEVRVVRHRPDFVVSEKVRGVIREALGPYRASGGWWESERWATEEWDIETEDGGLYRLARADGTWRVEGSYDEPPAESSARGIVPMNFTRPAP